MALDFTPLTQGIEGVVRSHAVAGLARRYKEQIDTEAAQKYASDDSTVEDLAGVPRGTLKGGSVEPQVLGRIAGARQWLAQQRLTGAKDPLKVQQGLIAGNAAGFSLAGDQDAANKLSAVAKPGGVYAPFKGLSNGLIVDVSKGVADPQYFNQGIQSREKIAASNAAAANQRAITTANILAGSGMARDAARIDSQERQNQLDNKTRLEAARMQAASKPAPVDPVAVHQQNQMFDLAAKQLEDEGQKMLAASNETVPLLQKLKSLYAQVDTTGFDGLGAVQWGQKMLGTGQGNLLAQIDGLKKQIASERVKQVLSGATSDKDLQFLQETLGSDSGTQEARIAAINNILSGINARKTAYESKQRYFGAHKSLNGFAGSTLDIGGGKQAHYVGQANIGGTNTNIYQDFSTGQHYTRVDGKVVELEAE